MPLFRFILWGFIAYFLYKLFKSLFKPTTHQRVFRQDTTQPASPPPFDPKNVEDIDYIEVKKKPSQEDPPETESSN